mgnify:CR=1 FL=1
MKYLENTIKFLGKFYILILPLYILAAVPALMNGVSALANYSKLMGNMMSLMNDPMHMQDPFVVINMFSGVFKMAAGAGFIAFILNFLVTPAAYGMINKALDTGHADLNDYLPALRENIVKYILYWIGTIVMVLTIVIAFGVIFLVLGLLTAVIKWIGVLLIVLAILGAIIVSVGIAVLVSLWFPAMVVDNLDVIAALRKSIAIAKGNFLTILGICILIWLTGVVAGSVLGLFGIIPVIGSLIASIVPAVTGFVFIVFFLMLYRDRTRGNVL